MKNKKNLWIALTALILAAAVGVGALFVSKQNARPMPVFPVSMLSYMSDGTVAGESSGVVTADRVQSVYVSDTQTVTRIHVYEGQKVRKGELLYTYDTTLSDLTLERKDLAIQQMEVNLKTAKSELTKLKAMKPMVVTTTNPKPSTSSKYDKSPTDRGYLDTVYAGSGTASDPYRFWLSQSNAVHEELIWDLLEGKTVVYVVFQSTKNDKTNTAFDEEFGLKLERLVVEVPTEPTDPTVPSEPEESTEPTVPSEPEESTEPTGSGDGAEPENTAGSGETADPESQTADTELDGTETGETAPTVNSQRKTEYTYAMNFFDPKEKVQEPSTQINWNSGYTQAELTAMREEKTAQIAELEFNIKMSKAELAIMKKEAADGKVYAQFDGTVVSVLEPDNARQVGMPMLKITGGGGYYVEGAVSELELDTVREGLEVSVNCWETGTVYAGVVTQVGTYPMEQPQAYGQTNVTYYPYKVFIDENADLQEGAFVTLTYETGGAEQVLYLENAFIRTEGKDSFVYVRNTEGLLEKRYIETGICTDGYATPVYSGLTEEDWIAFPYDRELREGMTTEEAQVDALYGN